MSEQMQELPTNSARKLAAVLFLALLIAGCRSKTPSAPQPSQATRKPASQNAPVPASPSNEKASSDQTVVLMHNVILDEPHGFKLRVRWLRGTMRPTRPGVVPSFDDANSFTVDVGDGVVALNLAEMATVLNSGMLKDSPLSNVSLAGSGQQ